MSNERSVFMCQRRRFRSFFFLYCSVFLPLSSLNSSSETHNFFSCFASSSWCAISDSLTLIVKGEKLFVWYSQKFGQEKRKTDVFFSIIIYGVCCWGVWALRNNSKSNIRSCMQWMMLGVFRNVHSFILWTRMTSRYVNSINQNDVSRKKSECNWNDSDDAGTARKSHNSISRSIPWPNLISIDSIAQLNVWEFMTHSNVLTLSLEHFNSHRIHLDIENVYAKNRKKLLIYPNF